MTAPVPTTIPTELRAGLTWQWTETLSDYPASTWTLTYWFKQMAASGAKFFIVASADGDTHSVSVNTTTTGAYTAGDYSWVAVVTSGSDAHEVASGQLQLLPKYNADAALDDRSHAAKMLTAVETAIEALQLGTKSYTLNNRQMTKRDLPELLALRSRYAWEVESEKAAARVSAGLPSGNRILVRL